MAFLRSPDELLELIVYHTIPEGFESLCLTCRKLYILCKPFIKQYNTLRCEFHNFDYGEKLANLSFTIRTSVELIARIAAEPVVARYIQHANFQIDHQASFGPRRLVLEDNGFSPDTVRDLYASSQYLAPAGIDWQKYHADFELALADNRYSQAAAAFILTLLPNVKSVTLPKKWKSDEDTEKLLETIVEQAGQSNVAAQVATLSKLITLKTYRSLVEQQGDVLYKITPLLALPHMRSFHGPSSVAHLAAGKESSLPHLLQPSISMTMETAHLQSCNLDGPAMEYFLRCTPRLKTLVYSHSTEQVGGPWNVCELVTAIVKEAGSHLEELSISIHDFGGPMAPGTASMRAFARLETLEIPLDLATCVIESASQSELQDSTKSDSVLDTEPSYVHPLMCGLVPASVSRLLLRSEKWVRDNETHESSGEPQLNDMVPSFQGRPQQHDRTLETMFRGFAARKDAQLPALREIRLSYPPTASEAYKARCRSSLPEAEKVGVTVYLDKYMPSMEGAGK